MHSLPISVQNFPFVNDGRVSSHGKVNKLCRIFLRLTFQRQEALETVHEFATQEVLMQLRIANMTCDGCAGSVTKVIQSVDPSAKVTADPGTRNVEILSDLPSSLFAASLEQAGYPVTSAT